MLTQRGVALLGGAILLWLVGRVLGIDELHVMAVAAAAIVVGGLATVHLGTASIGVQRTVSRPRVLPDTPSHVRLLLRNARRLPASLLLVSDDVPYRLGDPARFVVPGLSGGAQVTLRYPLTPRVRGRYRIGPLVVRLRDPFGVAQRIRRYGAIDEILVYPRVEPLGDGPARGAHRGQGASDTRRLLNSGDEFYTMREYVTGDDLRQVHWPSTAHRNSLMVRQQEQPWQARATVFCDLRAAAHRGAGADSTLEHGISAAASLLWYLADTDYQLRLVTDADAVLGGPQPWRLLLERLAEATSSDTLSLAPSLQRLRAAGGDGLLATVIAPPPGRDPVGRHADVQALLQAGRAFDSAIALVLAPTGGGDDRPAQVATLLSAAGWRATTITPGVPLRDAWQPLLRPRRPTGSGTAFQPDAAEVRR